MHPNATSSADNLGVLSDVRLGRILCAIPAGMCRAVSCGAGSSAGSSCCLLHYHGQQIMPILCDCLLSLQLLQTFPLVATESVLATAKVATMEKLIREMSTKTR